jgi:hypothetical protein
MKNILLLLLVLPVMWGCGYRLAGRGASIIPDDARTIWLPLFENTSTSPEAAGFVTESLRQGMVKRIGLELVFDGAAADLIMEGDVRSFQVKPLDQFEGGGTARYQVTVTVNLRLLDNRDNRLLYESRDLSFRDVYQTDHGDFFAMETDTLRRISKMMSSQILSLIFDEF